MFLFMKQLFCQHKERRCVHLRESSIPENFPRQKKYTVVAACLRCNKGFYNGRPQYCLLTKKEH